MDVRFAPLFSGVLPEARRYPLQLQLRYKAISKLGPVQGFGQTMMMSSQEIIFASGDGLRPGMAAEVALACSKVSETQRRRI
jgi:hypothetical protein